MNQFINKNKDILLMLLNINIALFIVFQLFAIIVILKSLNEDTLTMKQIKTTSEMKTETETTVAKVGLIIETTVQETQLQEPRYYCDWLGVEFNQTDFEWLCRTTYCEAGNQPIETQTMVCLTILNRLDNSDKFADTIKGVLYQHDAYEVTTWSDFESRTWTDLTEEAVRCALKENVHPRNMYYFRTEHYHAFGKPYMVSGDLWFSTEN